MHCTPGVTSLTGAQPAAPEHAGRMLDLPVGVLGLDDGPTIIALDLCVSDCGTGSPPAKYKAGAKSEAKGKDKRRNYPHDQPRRTLLPQLRAYG